LFLFQVSPRKSKLFTFNNFLDFSGSMAKFLGINRLTKLFQIVREAGGLKNAYLKLYR